MIDERRSERVLLRAHYLPPWRVDVTVPDGMVLPIGRAALARSIAAALGAAGAPSPASIGLNLAYDDDLAGLNLEYMGKDGPTDVLSFPLFPPDAFPVHAGAGARTPGRGRATIDFPLPPGRRPHLGDIVISVERAAEQAEAGRGGQTGDVRWSVADELRLLAVHGTLHICGWDHAEPAEEAAMRDLERRLLVG